MIDKILQMGCAFAYETVTHGIGEKTHVLTDDEDVQEVVLCGSMLYEIQMPEGERIRIQYDRGRRTGHILCFCL